MDAEMPEELREAVSRELDRRLALAMRAVRAARTLREAQRQYLATRSHGDREVVRVWERKLDQALELVPHDR